MLPASDLIRVAELIKLGADTARALGDSLRDGKADQLTDAADRIEAAAEELVQLGRQMDGMPSSTS